MSQLTVKGRVGLSAERAWALIADYGNIHLIHPKIERSPILSPNERGVGAVRRCEFRNGTPVVEEVTKWEEGKRVEMRITESPMPVHYATVTMEVRPAGETAAEVIVEMDYAVKYGPLGAIMNLLLMRPMMRRGLRQVIEGIDRAGARGLGLGEVGGGVPPSEGHLVDGGLSKAT